MHALSVTLHASTVFPDASHGRLNAVRTSLPAGCASRNVGGRSPFAAGASFHEVRTPLHAIRVALHAGRVTLHACTIFTNANRGRMDAVGVSLPAVCASRNVGGRSPFAAGASFHEIRTPPHAIRVASYAGRDTQHALTIFPNATLGTLDAAGVSWNAIRTSLDAAGVALPAARTSSAHPRSSQMRAAAGWRRSAPRRA
ncbi:MAG TPA: hypothetical protein VF756_01020 [Thermoanaerobaculia bacterium]